MLVDAPPEAQAPFDRTALRAEHEATSACQEGALTGPPHDDRFESTFERFDVAWTERPAVASRPPGAQFPAEELAYLRSNSATRASSDLARAISRTWSTWRPSAKSSSE